MLLASLFLALPSQKQEQPPVLNAAPATARCDGICLTWGRPGDWAKKCGWASCTGCSECPDTAKVAASPAATALHADAASTKAAAATAKAVTGPVAASFDAGAASAASDRTNLTAVLILLGQSNLVGRGRGDILHPTLLAQLRERRQRLEYYVLGDACGASCVRAEGCGLPPFQRGRAHCDDGTLTEQDLQPQLQPVRGEAWERALLGSDSRFGPELTLGLSLSNDLPQKYARLVVVKRAQLGLDISSLAANAPLYEQVKRDFAHVAARYGPAQTEPIGLLYMQGESDARSEAGANAFDARLRDLVLRMRVDLKAPSLPFIFPQLSGQDRPYQGPVDAAYAALAAKIPGVRYVLGPWPTAAQAKGPRATVLQLSETLTQIPAAQQRHVADEVCTHYSSASLLRIGAEVGRAMAELQGWAHHDIAAELSSWVESQDHEEAAWAAGWPDKWESCAGAA